MPAPPSFPGPTGNLQENYERLAQMDDGALNNMVHMMKQNPQLMKEQYERNSGVKMTDAEFENVMGMMNPEMIKMTSSMMKGNPELMKQAQEAHAQRAAA